MLRKDPGRKSLNGYAVETGSPTLQGRNELGAGSGLSDDQFGTANAALSIFPNSRSYDGMLVQIRWPSSVWRIGL